jgi:hypothetical protein
MFWRALLRTLGQLTAIPVVGRLERAPAWTRRGGATPSGGKSGAAQEYETGRGAWGCGDGERGERGSTRTVRDPDCGGTYIALCRRARCKGTQTAEAPILRPASGLCRAALTIEMYDRGRVPVELICTSEGWLKGGSTVMLRREARGERSMACVAVETAYCTSTSTWCAGPWGGRQAAGASVSACFHNFRYAGATYHGCCCRCWCSHRHRRRVWLKGPAVKKRFSHPAGISALTLAPAPHP